MKLIHGSLMYRDKHLEGYDAATVVEVIEHLDPPRLQPLNECYSARPKEERFEFPISCARGTCLKSS